jgi:hypothetical protein
MRGITLIIAILGIVTLVFGIVFLTQAASAEKDIAGEIQPVKLDEVNAKYDAVKIKQIQMMQSEEPQIQAGKAAASDTYNYLTVQRVSLAQARANMGLAQNVRMNGIINIVIGAALLLSALALFIRSRKAA